MPPFKEPNPNAHPSFDCLQAKTWAEHAICSAPELADADKQMAGLYEKTIATLSNQGITNVRQAQKEWIRQRELCSDKGLGEDSCLKTLYDARIATFDALADLNTRNLCQERKLCDTVRVSTAGVDAQGNTVAIIHLCQMYKEYSYAVTHGPLIESDCGVAERQEYWVLIQNEGKLINKQWLMDGGLADPDLKKTIGSEMDDTNVSIENNRLSLEQRRLGHMGMSGSTKTTTIQLSPFLIVDIHTEVGHSPGADDDGEKGMDQSAHIDNEELKAAAKETFKPDVPLFKCDGLWKCERTPAASPK